MEEYFNMFTLLSSAEGNACSNSASGASHAGSEMTLKMCIFFLLNMYLSCAVM